MYTCYTIIVLTFECLVDFFANLGASKNDFARDEDEKHDFRLHHAVDKTGEQLRLVAGESVMSRGQSLQANGELDVARANDILDLEVRELGVESELLDDTGVLAGCKTAVVLALGASDDHLAGSEYESGCLWLTNTHDHGSETLGVVSVAC